MQTRIELIDPTQKVIQLLTNCELPVSDIVSSKSLLFFGCHSDSTLLGAIGLEIHGTVALLRSLAVLPSNRGLGLGQALVIFAENYARSIGIESLFLLTTTAESFFSKLGYWPSSRSDAPLSIQSTDQFSSLCPSSSTLMLKSLQG